MKDLENKFIDKVVSEKIKEIKNDKGIVLRYGEIANVACCKLEGEYSELRNDAHNNTHLGTCEMIISNDNIYYIKKDPYKILGLKHPGNLSENNLGEHIFIQSVMKKYIEGSSINFNKKRICESCGNIFKLEKGENQFVLYFLGNDVKIYINNSFNAVDAYQSLIKLVPKEVIEHNKNINSNLNDDFQEFLGRINDFQDRCYNKIDTMEKEFNLENPIIESNTDTHKLFMANGAILDSENTIEKGYNLLDEFNNFDLNDNDINQYYGFFKLTLESLEETYKKVKAKYGPAISTYKTLRKITSKNAVYKPRKSIESSQDSEDDSADSTATATIWIVLIIIGIIILVAINS